MARRTNNLYDEYDLQVAKSSGIRRGVAICIAVFLLILGVAAIFVGFASRDDNGKLFGVSDTAKWCNYWGKGKPNTSDDNGDPDYELTPGEYSAIDNNGNLMREGVIYDMPESLAFIGKNSVQTAKSRAAATKVETLIAGNSVTLTATVVPENASDKRVTWSSNNQYVEITPLSEGSNVATVTVTSLASNVFSNGYANITCTSTSNPEASATCKVTRLASVDEVEFGAKIISQPPDWEEYAEYMIETSFMLANPMDNLCLGSISNIRISLEIQDDPILFEHINSQFAADELPYSMDNVGEGSTVGTPSSGGPNTRTFRIESPAQAFFNLPYNDPNITKVNNAIMRALKDYQSNLNLSVNIVVEAYYSYKNTQIGTVEKRIPYGLNLYTLWTEVEDVELGGE